MIKKIKFLFLCLILVGSLKAQDKKSEQNIVIKWNISSLVDYTPSMQFGVQYHLLDKFHLQHELGFISYVFSPFWDNESKLYGIRIKNTLKYYLPTFSRNFPIYLGFDLLYKNIHYNDIRQYSMYQDSYFQMIAIDRCKTVYAGTIIFGFEPFIIEDKLFLDFYAGLGYRHLTIDDSAPPENGIEVWRGSLFRRNEGFYNLPNISLGMRLGFHLPKKKKSSF